ncbi:MAG TPA: metal ABC transporter permease [Acidimicrobiia bacterium]|jgi:ABC-type Mn2+/Zn2+ transport system permease subunit
MIRWLSDPYQSQFMRHAALTALIVGVLSPTVGVWVVLRRLAYLGDAMSHATLAGVAGAYLLGMSVTVGALAAGVVTGAAIAVLGSHRRLGDDAVIGVVETAMFAVGVLLITRNDRIGVDLAHYLFGQVTTVSAREVAVNAGLAAAAIAVVAALLGDLRMATYDPLHARQVGVPVGRLSLVLLVVLSVTIVVSLRTVGLLMSIAMLVTPAATARLVTTRVTTMTLVAVAVGVVSALAGLTLSYHLRSAPGPTIALVAVACFAVAFVATRLLGTGPHSPGLTPP